MEIKITVQDGNITTSTMGKGTNKDIIITICELAKAQIELFNELGVKTKTISSIDNTKHIKVTQ